MNDIDKPERFDELPEERKRFLLDWISANLVPIQSINTRHSSYGIKEILQHEQSTQYFTNGEFKGAMLASGYKIKDINAQNWQFNVSEKSPCFIRDKKLR